MINPKLSLKVLLLIVLIGMIVFSLSFLLVIQSHQNNKRDLVEVQVKNTLNNIESLLEARLLALDRMASRHNENLEEFHSYWQIDAQNYHENFPGFTSLEWIDTKTEVKWIYPPQINKTIVSLQLHEMFKIKSFIEKALQSKEGVFANYIDSKNEKASILSIHPTFKDSIHTGFIAAEIDLKALLGHFVETKNYIQISFFNQVIYEKGQEEKSYFEYVEALNLRNLKVSVKMGISQKDSIYEILGSKNMMTPFLVLLIFTILAVAFYFLLEAKRRLSGLMLSLKDAKAAIDESIIYARTDVKGRIVEVNKKFEEISEYSEKELIGQDHRIINSGKHSKEFFTMLWKTISSGKVWRGEIQNRSKTGRLYWVDTSIIPLKNEEGKLIGYSALRKEITDIKSIEQDLRISEQVALQALETKSRFLANMSHEIRTPMNGILGFADLLSERGLDSDSHEKIKSIQSSGRILLRILDDILDFSKLEAGKVELEMISFDLRQEISQTLELLEEGAGQKGTAIHLEIDASIAQWVRSDPVRIRQIMTNLISNAIKFTTQGAIKIKGSIIKKDSLSFVQIDVFDSGVGIPLEQQGHLFKSFSQADISTTRKFGGTGLGLSICKGLIDLLGGSIWVESEVGVGSTFSFIFPYDPAEKPHAEEREQKADSVEIDSNLQILVAEDNSINRLVVSGFLERLGCQADFAFNGQDAFDKASNKHYDIIFMDCNMPVMDGYEATSKIKTLPDPPRVVALTASAMAEDRERCRKAGMDAFLSKPIRVKDLAEQLAYFS